MCLISISSLFILCCSNPRFVYYTHISSCHNPNSQPCARANYFGTDSIAARVTFYQLEIHRLLRNNAVRSRAAAFSIFRHTAGGRPRLESISDLRRPLEKSSPRERNKGRWSPGRLGPEVWGPGLSKVYLQHSAFRPPPKSSRNRQDERGLEGAHSLSIQTASYHETG